MNFKKLSAIAFVSAAILAGASNIAEAKPYWNAYNTSISITEDCSDEIIAQVKEKFESLKNADYAKASLSLNSVSSEQALKAINAFSNIKSLNLSKVNLTNLEFIKNLPNLEKFSYYCDTQFKEAMDLSALTGNTKLEELSFSSTTIKDLAPIGTCTNLEKVKIYMCYIESKTISPLKALTDLEELTLDNINTLTNFGELGNLTNLEELVVKDIRDHNTPENAIDTSIFANMPKLEKVSFEKVEINNLSKTGPELEEISLINVNKNNDKAFDITTIVAPQAEKLEIKEMKITNAESIAKNFPKLETLTLQKCEGITNYNFLKELPDKTRVTLSKDAITEDFKKELQETKKIYVNMW